MFTLTEPSDETVRRHLASQQGTPFSYPETGMTRPPTGVVHPAGYHVDHYRQRLSTGGDDDAFWRAKNAVERWAMFSNFRWLRLVRTNLDEPPTVGAVVAVVVRHFGFWSVNVSRVLYTVDESDHFGFAYGTLRGHAERGEERFLVERADDAVWFDLFALSRPEFPANLAAPLARRLQKRFAHDAQTAMLWASR